MAENGSEWVLVGAKRRGRKPASATRASAQRRTTAVAKKGPSAAAVNAHDDGESLDRIPPAKQRAIETRVERIATALLAQANGSESLVGATLCAASQHLGWTSAKATQRRLHVVSYGLGSFCSSSNAVHQLAFVHALVQAAKEQYGEVETTLEIFDPVMNASDREIAATLGVSTIEENESGMRVAAAPTVFFMPHCGHALYQNVVAANFTAGTLHNALIIGNSFEAYGDRLIDAAARKASVLLAVLPFVTESALPLGIRPSHDDFSVYESAFNDLSIHTFTSEQVSGALASVTLQTLIAGLKPATTGANAGDHSETSSVLADAMNRELIA